MEILLDTTVQIDRIFKRDKKKIIDKILSNEKCGTSTYVLGEFKNNIIKDFVTLYNIMQVEDSLAGVCDNINENVFNRSFQRIYYIFNDICKSYNGDYDLIKGEIKMYPARLEKRFFYGIERELLNKTNCHRANAVVEFNGGVAELCGIKCTSKDEFCDSCKFWGENKSYVMGLEESGELQEKMKVALCKVNNDSNKLKGNTCKSLGDCIIALEALYTEGKKVCTTNIKDYKVICEYIGVELYDVKDKQ